VLSLTERLGIPMPLNAEALSSLKDYTFWAKPDKAVRELGWQARPVEETFREVLDFEMKKRAMKK